MIKELSKYTIFMKLAIKRSLTYRGALYGGCFFVTMLVAVFYKLWELVFAQYSNIPFTFVDVIWYVATTEAILNATDKVHKQVEADVKNGDIAYSLNRPTSYFMMRQAEALGNTMTQWPLYVSFSWGVAFILTQQLPTGFHLFPLIFVTGFLGSYLHQLFISICGITALWTQDSSPAYMVYSKIVFLFGGLLFPLDIYPQWMQDVAYWIPAGIILYGPASIFFHTGSTYILSVVIRLVFWIIVAIGLNALCFHACQKRLSVNGG